MMEPTITIPVDLVIDEIIARLPAKSIARFRCVSKLWDCRLSSPRFFELFLTHSSSARPGLLFVLERANEDKFFFISPQPLNPFGSKSSTMVVEANLFCKMGRNMWADFRGFASGLLYFSNLRMRCDVNTVPMVYNLVTAQYASLPDLERYRKSFCFLGFDPIGKQFKMLFIAYRSCSDDHKILTLGTGDMSWRTIQCHLLHRPMCEGICVNGVLYYIAEADRFDDDGEYVEDRYVVVCFDVRSEVFKIVEVDCFHHPHSTQLINYKGRLGGIDLRYDDADAIELCLSVLEDIDRQEWSSYVYTLPLPENEDLCNVFVVGMTATGLIVLSHRFTSKPFYVFYFNPEKNQLQTVEIQGVGEYREAFETGCRVYAFADYVEDFNFIT